MAGTKRKPESPQASAAKAQRLERKKIAPQPVNSVKKMSKFIESFCEKFKQPEDSIRWLLADSELSVEEFIRTTWQKSPLVVPTKDGDAKKLKELFGYDFMARTIESRAHVKTRQRRLFPQLDFFAAKTVDDKSIEFDPSVADSPDHMTVEQLNKLIADGYTVQLCHLARFQPGLHALAEPLESYLGCLVTVNGYVSPAGGQMRGPRHDNEDYFVVQTEGAENWRLYPAKTELPLSFSETLSRTEIGDPILSVTLREGDVLYVPRGTVLESRAGPDSTSSYVVMSTYCEHYTGRFVKQALPRILGRLEIESVDLRRGLPVGFHRMSLGEKRDACADALLTLAEAIRSNGLSEVDQQESVHMMLGRFMTDRLPPFGVKAVYGDPNLTKKSKVRLRNKGHFAYYTLDTIEQDYYDEADEEVGNVDEEAIEDEEAESKQKVRRAGGQGKTRKATKEKTTEGGTGKENNAGNKKKRPSGSNEGKSDEKSLKKEVTEDMVVDKDKHDKETEQDNEKDKAVKEDNDAEMKVDDKDDVVEKAVGKDSEVEKVEGKDGSPEKVKGKDKATDKVEDKDKAVGKPVKKTNSVTKAIEQRLRIDPPTGAVPEGVVVFMCSLYNDVQERRNFYENAVDDKMITYPNSYRPILDRLMEATEPVTIAELSKDLGDGVVPLQLIQTLVNQGAVEIS